MTRLNTEFKEMWTHKFVPTERLPAGAGRISNVLRQVLKYDVLGNGAVGG